MRTRSRSIVGVLAVVALVACGGDDGLPDASVDTGSVSADVGPISAMFDTNLVTNYQTANTRLFISAETDELPDSSSPPTITISVVADGPGTYNCDGSVLFTLLQVDDCSSIPVGGPCAITIDAFGENGGTVAGTFSGDCQDTGGSLVAILNGRFNILRLDE